MGGELDRLLVMLPVCVLIASVAIFSGISGAAMLTPVFLIVFPLFNLPRLSTLAAIGTSLLPATPGSTSSGRTVSAER